MPTTYAASSASAAMPMGMNTFTVSAEIFEKAKTGRLTQEEINQLRGQPSTTVMPMSMNALPAATTQPVMQSTTRLATQPTMQTTTQTATVADKKKDKSSKKKSSKKKVTTKKKDKSGCC